MSDKNYIKEIEKSINERLHKKYFIDPKDYNKIKIENILYNNKTKLVSQFKEQLVIGGSILMSGLVKPFDDGLAVCWLVIRNDILGL